jgi:hypothetical protein
MQHAFGIERQEEPEVTPLATWVFTRLIIVGAVAVTLVPMILLATQNVN